MAKYNVEFWLLHTSVSEANLKIVADYCERLDNVRFRDVRVTESDDLKSLRDIGGKPDLERFLWLEAHKYLPETLDRAIYLDALDLIVVNDISKFYFGDFEGKLLLTTKEINRFMNLPQMWIESGQRFFEETNDVEALKRISSGIFNSGSMVLNLERFRNEAFPLRGYRKVMEWAKQHIDFNIGDQGLFSLARGSDFKLCDIVYNYRFFIGGAKYFSTIAIVHFCGWIPKPYGLHFSQRQEELVIEKLYQVEDKFVMLDHYLRLYDHYLPYYRVWWDFAKDTPIYSEYHFKAQQFTTRKLFDLGLLGSRG